MKERIFMWILVLFYAANQSHGIESSNVTSLTQTPNKNTSYAVQQEVITTTRRPFLQGVRLPCSCQEGECGCCTGPILDRFNQKACLNITYEPDEFAFTAALRLNGRVLYRNSISGKNPPPVCIRLPRFRFVQLCVEFSNIYFANRNMHVCIDMEANWETVTLLDFSFDCIRMGVNGVAVVKPEEGGGIPVPVPQEIEEDYDDNARNNEYPLQNLNDKTEVRNLI
ncbi:hypothetical protein RN001_016103 [Aquatica leii]|uniref:DUF4773 domain-containing protein n=1 Tax=Aquatica leii TaxID=1421715 RepID=A0AAN7SB69_9COLE|nr:hypothetical protein RN001_016103 [Aquatica leii]